MAQNDPYLPDAVSVANGSNTTFDASSSGTGTAIASGLYGTFDAEIYLEDSPDGGTTWNTVSQFADDAGNTTFTAQWATQFNRVMIEGSKRRLRIENVGSSSGYVALDGDER